MTTDSRGLSMHDLARTFKAEAGLAPHAFQVRLRVLRAKRLLAAGPSTAGTAGTAAECRSFDQAHLTSQFKQHVGVTPDSCARGGVSRPCNHRPSQSARVWRCGSEISSPPPRPASGRPSPGDRSGT
jgi:AraC-like DNA-binding protein